ncbi:vacuolar amino acid transporter 4 [Scheffersomyces coipomensis]|uniref:vacuolar amino acid transporter 4 n=1 Tax=Scheffersomyces coipomensis TaxID=1788519 RepID=UPI00315C8DBB
MSSPQNIQSNSSRRRSIALLTRSPLSSSPLIAHSPKRGNSANNSYVANVQFLRTGGESRQSLVENEEAIDSQSSNESSTQNLIPESAGISIPSITENTDYSAGIEDPKLLAQVAKHLHDSDSLKAEGADITRDLYRLSVDNNHLPRRSRSFDSAEWTRERRESGASSLNVPGGFRRDFLNHKFNVEEIRTVHPNFLTRNFVEFLSIYGHFAGEELEDEEDIACHYKIPEYTGERSPLLGSNDQEVNPKGTATDRKAYFLLLKAFVGTGVLFLPRAFSNGGLTFSILTLVFFGALSLWCYLILVYSKISTKLSGFGEMGSKLYGNWLQRLILSSIVLSQIGFVAAYIVFTSENLRAFISNVSGYPPSDFEIIWFIIFQVIILLPLSLIRDITKLSLSAVLANLFILFGLVTILYYIFYEWLYENKGTLGPNIEYIFNSNDFSLFIGVAVFAFEGIGLIIPIHESMIYPNNFPKVLCQVIFTISFIFILIGSLGYITFGDQIKTVIILNLPQTSPMVILIQLLYSFAILLSTPLQLFPAIRLLESKLFFRKTGKNSLRVKWYKNVFRFLFVVMVSYVALIGGQNLDKFVSFVGCFACIPLVYMYPPMLHLKSCCVIHDGLSDWEKRKRFWLGLLDYVLVLIGFVVMLYTTYQILFT